MALQVDRRGLRTGYDSGATRRRTSPDVIIDAPYLALPTGLRMRADMTRTRSSRFAIHDRGAFYAAPSERHAAANARRAGTALARRTSTYCCAQLCRNRATRYRTRSLTVCWRRRAGTAWVTIARFALGLARAVVCELILSISVAYHLPPPPLAPRGPPLREGRSCACQHIGTRRPCTGLLSPPPRTLFFITRLLPAAWPPSLPGSTSGMTCTGALLRARLTRTTLSAIPLTSIHGRQTAWAWDQNGVMDRTRGLRSVHTGAPAASGCALAGYTAPACLPPISPQISVRITLATTCALRPLCLS